MAFLKLDCGILNSTIWFNRPAREVFITALLMAEPWELTEPTAQLHVESLEPTGWIVPPGWYGHIGSSGVGIIHRALVEPEEGIAALIALGSPERDSRSSAHEGRRLVRIDGGYLALNYALYRERDYGAAERMRRFRARKKNGLEPTGYAVTEPSDGVTVTPELGKLRNDTQAEGEAEEERSYSPSSQDSSSEAALAAPAAQDVPRGAKRGTRLADDAELTPEWRTIAQVHRLAPEATFRYFKNYWLAKPGKEATKLDWTRTWANWCAKEAERLPGYKPPIEHAPFVSPGVPDVAPGEPRNFLPTFAKLVEKARRR